MESKQLHAELMKNQQILRNIAFKFTKDPEEIQELVQDALVKSINYVDKFFNHPKLVAWLYVIIKNAYINNYRRHQKQYRFEDHQKAAYKGDGCAEPAVGNHAESKFIMSDIKRALNKLPADYQVLFMRYTEGYKYRELSEEFGMPEGTIKTRIHFIRKTLQKQLAVYRQNDPHCAA